MAEALIERDEEIDMALTALICREHPLFVGPPGTAKSLMLDSLMSWMGPETKKFSILFNKFTVPEEVFGPISVKGMQEDCYRRVTTNMLPEANVGFGDEIFKASPAILNTILRILNERVFVNGDGKFHKVPLHIFVAGSNEWASGEELGALFDRFLFRKKVKYISSKKGRDKLLWVRDHEPALSTQLSPHELNQAQREAKSLWFSVAAKRAFVEIIEELNKEGIRPGDRRMYKAVDAVKAFAYLSGTKPAEELDEPEEEAEGYVAREHLEILSHVLWDDPTEQPEKAAKIVAKIANPNGAVVSDKLMQAEDIIEKNSATEAVPKLQAIQKELEALGDDSINTERIKKALKYISGEIKRLYQSIVGDM